ncbi:hypothetical protein LWI28_012173 [Acer negundo]|uniref:Pentatricopeptide repeat-containing protein n=1 Tax=Acer negundo TaxID=4023 RepID=A0AAD5J5J5_ACENE|nr:hypothetical protein LWI28_012173 [Acer negundo]
MRFQDVMSWTSMISSYGMSGKGYDAVALFSKRQNSGLYSDSIAFVSFLSACSHSGLLEERQYNFKLMTERYKIIPRIEHFACFVDLLGRARKVEEAYSVIRQMPIGPHERVWVPLLGVCRLYSKLDIGLLAADHLFRLAQEQSGYYVLISNIYAKAGRWDDVTTIRSIMKRKRLKEMPVVSNVEINNQVYTFLSVINHIHSRKRSTRSYMR